MSARYNIFALRLCTLVALGSPVHGARSSNRTVPERYQPAPLTVDVLRRMATFWTTFLRLPDSIRTARRTKYQKPLLCVIEVTGDHDRSLLLPAVVDMVELARQFPSVVTALRQVQLTPQQWEQYRYLLFTAMLTDQVASAMGHTGQAIISADSARLVWQNVAFLRAHQANLDTVRASGMWFPKLPAWIYVRADTVRLNDTILAATFTLTNTFPIATDVWLAMDCGASSDSAEHDDLLAGAWRNRSSCAVPWLGGYPQHIQLAPNERRTLPIVVHSYPTLPDGRYTARMVWVAVKDDHNQDIIHYEFTITYNKGREHPRRSRMQWQPVLTGRRNHAHLQATPAVLVMDDHTPTATVMFTNPAVTATEVWVALDCPWFRNNVSSADLLPFRSSQFESGWHARLPNVTLWLSGYPQYFVLAPHERRTITLTMSPPIVFGDPAGSYYARVVYVQSPVLTAMPAGDTVYMTPHGAIPVVYHHRVARLRLTLSQLHRVQQPDGTSQACVTVQQPGIGVVAVLHAEVDDARGNPLRSRASPRSNPAAWALDSTVSVWEVVHHNPEDIDKDADPKSPAPVCFALPSVPPGHYQLVVTAATLEDMAKQQVARATLPWEVP